MWPKSLTGTAQVEQEDKSGWEATNHWTEGGSPPQVESMGWEPGQGIAAGSFR